MKRYLTIALLLISSVGFSQENNIKMGVSGILYGDYSLGYERLITPTNSLNLTIGYLNPNISLIGLFDLSFSSGGIRLDKLKSGFHASVDYRFYVGQKKAPIGLYVAPYLRYFNYNMVLNDTIDNIKFDVDTKISSIGLGFQLGYQWIISDVFSIDLYFLGIGVEYMMPTLVYTTENSNFNYSTIESDVKDVFKGWNYFQKRLKTTPEKDNMTAKLPTFFPGIKTGLTIGYCF